MYVIFKKKAIYNSEIFDKYYSTPEKKVEKTTLLYLESWEGIFTHMINFAFVYLFLFYILNLSIGR